MATNTTKKEERVPLFVPKGLKNEDPNLYVSINGEKFLIPKGETSMVPPYVKAAVERSWGAESFQQKHQDAMSKRSEAPVYKI